MHEASNNLTIERKVALPALLRVSDVEEGRLTEWVLVWVARFEV